MQFRRVLIAFLFGALLMVSIPAIANHVNEPVAPIVNTEIELFQYGNKPATLLTACDGTETVMFDQLRIESIVTSTGVPSEHFDEWVIFNRLNELGRSPKYIWSVRWRHSNIPPHPNLRNGVPNRWESSQTNQDLKDYAPGTRIRVTSLINGLVSGNVFEESCDFIVG